MTRSFNVFLTALAPAVWGSTYIVTTELLPEDYPITAAMLRALPAGLLLLLIVRSLPRGRWAFRAFVLGALNFSVFWWLLFVSAYRLPGGVAATIGAVQPLIVLALARHMLDQAISMTALIAGLIGVLGVALLVLTPAATLDGIGILAALGGAASMALGTILTKTWQPPVSPLTFTAWQLTAGGILLLPMAVRRRAGPSSTSPRGHAPPRHRRTGGGRLNGACRWLSSHRSSHRVSGCRIPSLSRRISSRFAGVIASRSAPRSVIGPRSFPSARSSRQRTIVPWW